MEDKISKFLSGFALFSKLPKKEVSFVAGEIEVKKYPKSTILAVQGRTKMDCVYIIKTGSMELFYETEGHKNIKGILEPVSLGYKPISWGLSIRTLVIIFVHYVARSFCEPIKLPKVMPKMAKCLKCLKLRNSIDFIKRKKQGMQL